MAYLGQVDRKASNVQVFNVTSSTSATHSIGWTPPSEQTLIVTINGVKQHTNAYSFSGATLTLGAALVATDELEVIGINDIGNSLTPVDGSVSTSKLGDDSVSTAKVQDNAVTLAKMAGLVRGKIIVGDASGDPSALTVGGASTVLTSDGTDAAWVAAAAGGLTAASQWRLNTSFTSSAEPIASNLEEVDAPVGFGVLGSSMTESLGLFTFPSTGYWFIQFHTEWSTPNNNPWMYSRIYTTTDDSTYTLAAQGNSYGKTDSSQIVYTNANTSYIFDVTSTSTHKIRFDIVVYDANITTVGATNDNRTCMTFLRLADRP